MPIYAFKNGVTPFSENVMNQLLSLQPFKLLYEGAQIDIKTGSGTTENPSYDYHYGIRFTATGVTAMSRLELTMAKNGEGKDLIIEILDSDFNPDGSAEGTVLKAIVLPKEFIPTNAGKVYIPLNLTGLTEGNDYWIKVAKTGDLVDHFVLIGESSQDASHPCYYRSGTSGAWTDNNAIHFAVYDGLSGDVIHSIIGDNAVYTYTFDGEDIDKIYLYIPPADGPDGGVRQIQTLSIVDEYLDEGTVDE